MALQLTFSSMGDNSKGQDPFHPLPGVPNGSAVVADFKEASEAVSRFIEEHKLDAITWTGGQIVDGGQLIARVTHDGKVWNEPRDYFAGPLYDPVPDPLKAFAAEVQVIEVPGHGTVRVSANRDRGFARSEYNSFMLDGRPVEFHARLVLKEDGSFEGLRSFPIKPGKGLEVDLRSMPADVLDRILQAVRGWHAQELDGSIWRNDLKQMSREIYTVGKEIEEDQRALDERRQALAEKVAARDALAAEIEPDAAPVPGM